MAGAMRRKMTPLRQFCRDFDDAELGHVGSSPARSTPLVASLPIQPGSAIALPCGDDGEGNLTGFKTEPATRKQRKIR